MLSLRKSPAERDEFLRHLNHIKFNGKTGDLSEPLWDSNVLVRAWYSGVAINFSLDESNPDIRVIPFKELSKRFCSFQRSDYPRIISETMWNANSGFRSWYRGEDPNRPLTEKELIHHFKRFLTYGRFYLAVEMWKENSPLQKTFKALPSEEQKSMLKVAKNHRLYTLCLDCINNLSLEQSLLLELDNDANATRTTKRLANFLRTRMKKNNKRKASSDIVDDEIESTLITKKQKHFSASAFFADAILPTTSATDTPMAPAVLESDLTSDFHRFLERQIVEDEMPVIEDIYYEPHPFLLFEDHQNIEFEVKNTDEKNLQNPFNY